MPVLLRKSLSAAALLAGVICAGTPLAAFAQSAPNPVAHHGEAAMRGETVDQRIATLHGELRITSAEEADWQAVAMAMRDNATTMQNMAADKADAMKQGLTAIEDLQIYSEFAQAHVDGLKHLMSSFQTLYNSMPDAQKKIADQVFQNARHQEASIAH